MAIVFKKILKANPVDRDKKLYYPHLLTMGKKVDEDYLVFQIKELSALSKGDIKSVASNLFDVIRNNLYMGHSVHIRNFGIFSLSARTEGSETEKECTAKSIKSVHINFRPSKSNRPDINATRAEDKLTFIDFTTYLKSIGVDENQSGSSGGSGSGDPNA